MTHIKSLVNVVSLWSITLYWLVIINNIILSFHEYHLNEKGEQEGVVVTMGSFHRSGDVLVHLHFVPSYVLSTLLHSPCLCPGRLTWRDYIKRLPHPLASAVLSWCRAWAKREGRRRVWSRHLFSGFFPVGFLWAIWLQSLVWPSSHSFLSGALFRTPSLCPSGLRMVRLPSVSSPRHCRTTCGVPVLCPHFGK